MKAVFYSIIITLLYSCQQISSDEEYSDRVNYCAFKFQNDISLYDGKDSIPCSLFHFERAFDIVPYGKFILGFAKSNHPENAETFIVYDKIFHKGLIKFTFDP